MMSIVYRVIKCYYLHVINTNNKIFLFYYFIICIKAVVRPVVLHKSESLAVDNKTEPRESLVKIRMIKMC